jgi:hypothetical protein
MHEELGDLWFQNSEISIPPFSEKLRTWRYMLSTQQKLSAYAWLSRSRDQQIEQRELTRAFVLHRFEDTVVADTED